MDQVDKPAADCMRYGHCRFVVRYRKEVIYVHRNSRRDRNYKKDR